MEQDKPLDPTGIGLFSSIGIVALSQGITDLIEQFRLFVHLTPPLGFNKLLLLHYIIYKQIFGQSDQTIESFCLFERYKLVRCTRIIREKGD